MAQQLLLPEGQHDDDGRYIFQQLARQALFLRRQESNLGEISDSGSLHQILWNQNVAGQKAHMPVSDTASIDIPPGWWHSTGHSTIPAGGTQHAAHKLQVDEPVPVWYAPAQHKLQADEPAPVSYVPALHRRQSVYAHPASKEPVTARPACCAAS